MKQERIFGKAQLRNGMLLEFKDGRKGMLFKEVSVLNDEGMIKKLDIIKFRTGFTSLDKINEDLKGIDNEKYTVMRVYEIAFWGKDFNNILSLTHEEIDYACIWERKEESKEENVDWTKIEEFTPVEGYCQESGDWLKGYFLGLKDGKIVITPTHPIVAAMAGLKVGVAAGFDKARLLKDEREEKLNDFLKEMIKTI